MEAVQTIIILGIIALIMWIVGKIASKFKFPKIGCVALVTGAVKAGKSTFAVALSIQKYKRAHRAWKIRAFFQKVFGRKISEEPLLYSNIPLSVPYVPLTKDLIMRKKRFRYGSVLYVNEASLLADSLLGSQDKSNKSESELVAERLTLFNKLFGHETYGGYLIYDTQCIVDLHFSIKRCISEYFYIHHLEKHIPFFLVAKVREERHSEDKGSVVNTYADDVEDSLKRVIIPKRTWKKFDAYCFSYLTDNLPVEDNVIEGATDLKAREIISFRDFKTIDIKDKKSASKPAKMPVIKDAKEVLKNEKANN